MEFRKFGFFNVEKAPTTATHIDIDLTDTEIMFELKDKHSILEKLFRREFDREDSYIAHIL